MLNYQRVQYFIIVMLSGFGLFLSRIDLVVLRLVWSVRTAFESLHCGCVFASQMVYTLHFDAF